jgi:energy-converting hydrogenase Eha subunit G
MSFSLFILGLAVLIGGIAWALVTAGIAITYVAIACLIVAGIGIMAAVSRTRAKDPPL